MRAYTHALIGISAYIGVATMADMPNVSVDVTTIAAAFAGSVLPDIDHPNSWIGCRLRFLSLPLWGIFGHRGFTHSLVSAALISSLLYLLTQVHMGIALALFIGYIGHLLGDFITGGIPLLWPQRKTYRFPIYFAVGGIVEHIIFVGLLAVMVINFKETLAILLNTANGSFG